VSLDALAAAALADDLGSLAGARVQSVTAVDPRTLCFELYAGERRYLTLSAAPDHPGVVVEAAPTRRGGGAPSPLALVCRARLDGARLSAVVQPPHERILRFDWKAAAPISLVAELTGRLANLILVDADGTILAAAHAVTAAQSRARTVLPGRPYAPPPAPLKVPPESVTPDDIRAWLHLAPNGEVAWRTLVAHVRGIGPQTAREIVFRSADNASIPAADADPTSLSAALAAMAELPASHAWAPTIAVSRTSTDGDDPGNGRAVSTREDGAGDAAEPGQSTPRTATVLAWAPYRLTHLAAPDVALVDCPTTLDALARWHGARSSADRYRAARAGVVTALAAATARVRRRREALEHQLAGASPAAIASLKEAGDLILGFQWQIATGATTLIAPLEPPVTIRLDPDLTPVANAQAYFDRYRRARRAARGVPARLAAARAAEDTLLQLGTDLALAENRAEIDAVLDALAATGLAAGVAAGAMKRRTTPTDATSRPRRYASTDGLTLLVGRNSRQNEVVTFQLAARGDIWLHARDVPGAHVVVKAAGRNVPEATLNQAAALAAWFSASRDAAAVAVAVTDARHVRRLAGGGAGMVTLSHEATRTVRPASPRALGLEPEA